MMQILHGKPLRIDGRLVVVGSGIAWITRRGRAEDWVLVAGQRMTLTGKGWVVQNLRADEELNLRLEPISTPAPVRTPQARPSSSGKVPL